MSRSRAWTAQRTVHYLKKMDHCWIKRKNAAPFVAG